MKPDKQQEQILWSSIRTECEFNPQLPETACESALEYSMLSLLDLRVKQRFSSLRVSELFLLSESNVYTLKHKQKQHVGRVEYPTKLQPS